MSHDKKVGRREEGSITPNLNKVSYYSSLIEESRDNIKLPALL